MVVERKRPPFQNPFKQLLTSLSRGWALTKLSASVLKTHKNLMIFPIISFSTMLLVIVSFSVPLFASSFHLGGNWIVALLCGLTFYLLTYFIIIFFNVGLVFCTLKVLSNEPTSFSEGVAMALQRLPQIFRWALFSALFGVLINMAEHIGERFGVSISAILGTAWSAIVYFVLPVITFEGLGPVDAIKKSADILYSRWGEAGAGNISLWLIGLLLFLPLFLLGHIMATIVPENTVGLGYMFGFFIVVVVPCVVIIAMLQSTLSTILATLLYATSTGMDLGLGEDFSMVSPERPPQTGSRSWP